MTYFVGIDIGSTASKTVVMDEDGVVEALCHRRFPVWAIQWHPERMPGEMGENLLRAFLSLCP